MSENASENQNTADTVETDAKTTVENQQNSSTAASAPVESEDAPRRDEKLGSAYAVVAGEEAPSAEDLQGRPGYKDEDADSVDSRKEDDEVL